MENKWLVGFVEKKGSDIQVQYPPHIKGGEDPIGCWVHFESDCNNGSEGEGMIWLDRLEIARLIKILEKSLEKYEAKEVS